jgi:hypothetical protein
LKMDYAADRLAPSGLLLEKNYYRNKSVTEYVFSEMSGELVFRTCVYLKACVFVETLKGISESTIQRMTSLLPNQ